MRSVDNEFLTQRRFVDRRHPIVLPVRISRLRGVDQVVGFDEEIITVLFGSRFANMWRIVIDAIVADVEDVRLPRHEHARFGVVRVAIHAIVYDFESRIVVQCGYDEANVPVLYRGIGRYKDVEVGSWLARCPTEVRLEGKHK